MPNFNFAGEKGGLYCSQHKQEGMIDIKHKRCMHPDCPKRPSFNYTGAPCTPAHALAFAACQSCLKLLCSYRAGAGATLHAKRNNNDR